MRRIAPLPHWLIASFFIAVMSSAPTAYLKLGFFTNRDADGVTAAQLQAAMARAFSTWASVPHVTITHSFTGFTGAEPFAADGINVIGFSARPELERTLGAATFEFDEVTGQIQ